MLILNFSKIIGMFVSMKVVPIHISYQLVNASLRCVNFSGDFGVYCNKWE